MIATIKKTLSNLFRNVCTDHQSQITDHQAQIKDLRAELLKKYSMIERLEDLIETNEKRYLKELHLSKQANQRLEKAAAKPSKA